MILVIIKKFKFLIVVNILVYIFFLHTHILTIYLFIYRRDKEFRTIN